MLQYTVAVKDHGRLNLPKSLRAALHLQDGDDLVFRVNSDGVAEVVSASTLAQRGTGLFVHLKQEDSETDAFLAERRAEADQ
ncbi:AbrB/MazE/SpoVT family DNA-binding domain-containing protein [Deinococcus arenicola]|uniref:AbrB/MazE/SpoVT family DNA-binding domain-containing protein n=1 Tax=Deinococcus arenicola TaxID=2994950 RepID=A0ABU4DVU2_9DEIO|nr:AbrB/MazE/SpoVT family DNA-binding domain-containing protein [Deinococcus sp. ZS9-10]MDV6376578.1 AbrB/MazE/SpoVT family DNA-binding domain-containing protein [Deinococcus sp. ZS9-10]